MQHCFKVFLLLLDDRIRKELILELNATKGFILQGIANDLGEIELPALAADPLHVIVVNFDHPETHNLHLWSILKSFPPREISIVALTSGESKSTLEIIMAIGVHALHPTTISGSRLMKAIIKVCHGQVDFDRGLNQLMKKIPLCSSHLHGSDLSSPNHNSINLNGQEIILSPLESKLFHYLELHVNEWISVDELLEAVWKTDKCKGGTADQVKSCIKRIRDKIEPDRVNPRHILSSKSAGYKLQDITARKIRREY